MEDYYENKWLIHFKLINGLYLGNGIMGNKTETVIPCANTITIDALYRYVESIFFEKHRGEISHPFILTLKPYRLGSAIIPSVPLPIDTTIRLSNFLNDNIQYVSQSYLLKGMTSYVIYVSPRNTM